MSGSPADARTAHAWQYSIPRPRDVEIGRRIAARRKELGISQLALGFEVGVAEPTISHYEHAKIRVPPARLAAIAEALGMPVSWFLDGNKGERS